MKYGEQMNVLRDCFHRRANWSTSQLADLGVKQSGQKIAKLNTQKGWKIANHNPDYGRQYERNYTAITLGTRVSRTGRPKGSRNKATRPQGMPVGEMMGLMRRAAL